MDSQHWNGDDDRDVFDPDDEPPCWDCGAPPDEPCEPECGCGQCIAKRDPMEAA